MCPLSFFFIALRLLVLCLLLPLIPIRFYIDFISSLFSSFLYYSSCLLFLILLSFLFAPFPPIPLSSAPFNSYLFVIYWYFCSPPAPFASFLLHLLFLIAASLFNPPPFSSFLLLLRLWYSFQGHYFSVLLLFSCHIHVHSFSYVSRVSLE